jgi:hypothetical protein
MRTSRPFRPSSMPQMEGRVLLTHVWNLTANFGVERPPADVAQTLTPSDLVPGAPAAPAGGNTFPLDIANTLKAGSPVYEQKQTIDSAKAVNEIIDELIVPNPATGGSTTTEWIEGAGFKDQNSVETVVDVKTVDGNTTTDQVTTTLPDGSVQTEVETAVHSGTTTTHTNVTTLPDGQVQTNKYTDVQEGNRVLIKDGSEPAPDGRIERYSGVKHTVGDRTYTSETFTQPAGLVKTTDNMVRSFGDAGQNQVIMTHMANGPAIITNHITTVSRLNPPTS